MLEAAAGEYDYQERPLVQTSVVRDGHYKIFSNPNPPTRHQPIVFEFKGDPYRYIDLNDSYFEFVVRVTGAAEAALEAVSKIEVGPINYLAQTM